MDAADVTLGQNGGKSGREYPLRPILTVGGVVVRDGAVLLIQRAQEPERHRWTIPGGAVRVGEPVLNAVAREVQEETGLVVTPLFPVEIVDRIRRDPAGRVRFHYVILDFVCRYVSGNVCADSDALEAAWVECDALSRYDLIEGTAGVIHKAVAVLEHGPVIEGSADGGAGKAAG